MKDVFKDINQRSEKDEEFHRKRMEFIERSESFRKGFYVDHPFVLCSRQSLTSSLFRLKMYEKIINIQGSIIECGVHRGNHFMLFNHLISIYEPYNLNRKVIGFDTFEGFTSISNKDPAQTSEDMFSDTSYEELKELLSIHENNKAVPHIHRGELIKGDACQTIPAYVKENPHLVVALLYLDFDLYEPTKTALQYLAPLVPKGGIIAFDELNISQWPGEAQALKEFFNMNDIKIQRMSFEPYACFFVVGE